MSPAPPPRSPPRAHTPDLRLRLHALEQLITFEQAALCEALCLGGASLSCLDRHVARHERILICRRQAGQGIRAAVKWQVRRLGDSLLLRVAVRWVFKQPPNPSLTVQRTGERLQMPCLREQVPALELLARHLGGAAVLGYCRAPGTHYLRTSLLLLLTCLASSWKHALTPYATLILLLTVYYFSLVI